ncbi:MAG TPA: bifunctional phosphopantothenoylcysteine decarboxylase/phosphopantothenate--cysteine ligase CoaBC [Pyrinomonadaceae bacterium]|nr:bifunctional phosphopantothenoylcysteine decarboxylase/phosphopantothenate--cysteine ligase CoaBC [Pyrinomonadaceae bacterium]
MSDEKKKFRVGLGVCGGIAAYKAIEVLRLLQKANCEVRVAMTRHATEFIQPLTFRALTENYVLVDDYAPENPDPIAHINFSQNIDLLLIVPATANIIAKFANGIADDFLTSTYLASNAPVMIAPAMNVTMWNHPSTQRNIAALRKDGVYFVEPVAGELACKTVGTGKLEDVENIAAQALNLLVPSSKSEVPGQNEQTWDLGLGTSDLKGESLLITVGGTREAIDPVRFISNHSSGKMGFAVAEMAAKRGARVTVVCGVTTVEPPENIEVIRAVSAEEMFQAVMKKLPEATVFIGAAAVADYRPKAVAEVKIKKTVNDIYNLELEKTPDILSNVSANRHHGLLVVGFAAETNDVVSYAKSKMVRKNLDLVVANDITKKGAGFNSDTNIATIVSREKEIDLPLMSKRELADKILDEVIKLRDKVKGKR